MQYECPICMEDYDGASQQPLVIGVCGHTICGHCSTKIDRCPFCKTAFDKQDLHKNYALCSIIFSMAFLSIKERRPRNPLEIKQQNLVYETQLRKITMKCPEGHNCMWYHIIDSCSKCMDSKTGWKCTKCAHQICDICAKTDFRRGCPNGHKLSWRNEKHRCQSCFTKCQLFHCLPCKYTICNICMGKDYKRNWCPNQHKTAWNESKSKCNCCLMYAAGWQCDLCSYNMCEVCSGTSGPRKRSNRLNVTQTNIDNA